MTPRLEVRRLTMADLEAFHEIWGDPAKSWQGRGYATEAAAGLLAHAKLHGVDRAYAKILPDNVASRGVALRREHDARGHGVALTADGLAETACIGTASSRPLTRAIWIIPSVQR